MEEYQILASLHLCKQVELKPRSLSVQCEQWAKIMGGRLGARQEPSYHSGRHHHKVRPTSPTTSNLRPSRKARKRPTRIFLRGENFNQFANCRPAAAQRGMWPFFCKARRANSKIKGGGGAMAAWECS